MAEVDCHASSPVAAMAVVHNRGFNFDEEAWLLFCKARLAAVLEKVRELEASTRHTVG